MRVMVTGGAGFFGANLVRCLAASAGVEEVVCADLALPDEVTARYLAPVAERVRGRPARCHGSHRVRPPGERPGHHAPGPRCGHHPRRCAGARPAGCGRGHQPGRLDQRPGRTGGVPRPRKAAPGQQQRRLRGSGSRQTGCRCPAQPERRRPLAPGQPVRRHQTLRRAAGGTLCGDSGPSGRRRAAGAAVRPIWNGLGVRGRTPRRSIDWPRR